MSTIRTILHPTDLSEHAKPAFDMACALAHDYAARLIVLHAYPPPFTGAEAVDQRRDDSIADDLLLKLRQLVPANQSVPVDYRVAEGSPADEILHAARSCDLIVMGTHGRTGLRRMLVGSVAEKVLREAPCPVLTIRPSAHLLAEKPAAEPGGD